MKLKMLLPVIVALPLLILTFYAGSINVIILSLMLVVSTAIFAQYMNHINLNIGSTKPSPMKMMSKSQFHIFFIAPDPYDEDQIRLDPLSEWNNFVEHCEVAA